MKSVKPQATRFEKAVAAAFKYYPFGMNEPKSVDGWVFSPVFAARIPSGAYDEGVLVALIGESKNYTEYQDWSKRFTQFILPIMQKCTQEVSIAPEKHGDKCTARVATFKNGGSVEVVYPLINLMKAAGATQFFSDGDFYITAFDDANEPVAVVAGRKGCGNLPKKRKDPKHNDKLS